MRENFPHKKAGDTISAGDWNKLTKIAREAGTPDPGAFSLGRGTARANIPPFIQGAFTITSDANEESSASSSSSGSQRTYYSSPTDVYGIKPRYFNPDNNTWETDVVSIEYELDAGAIDATFGIGAFVIAFWDPQRGMFIPIGGSSGSILEGVLDDPLPPADSALEEPSFAILSVYAPDEENENDENFFADTDMDILVTNRMTEHEAIETGTWVVVQRINGEWRPIAADCGPTTLLPESSSSSSFSAV